jgi:hypothetical protein
MAASLLLVAGATTACGTSTPGPDAGGTTVQGTNDGSSTTATQATTGGRLVVTVTDGAGAAPRRMTLECDPVGGDHPDAAAACAALAAASDGGRDPFAPTPADAVCTQIYGGPQTATVTGTWRGTPVDARFDRTNGCEISRWDALGALLGRGGA